MLENFPASPLPLRRGRGLGEGELEKGIDE